MKSLLVLTLLLTLGACSPPGSTTKEIVQKDSSPTPATPNPDKPPGQNQMGGADMGGGGHGVKGRPLESYYKELQSLQIYHTEIEPMLHDLSAVAPELAAGLYRTATHRRWYFIPADLTAIPSLVIGAPTETDQLAYQNFYQVWMDDRFYSKMSATDQKTILIHEMVMGSRILSYHENLEKCLTYADISFVKNRKEIYTLSNAASIAIDKIDQKILVKTKTLEAQFAQEQAELRAKYPDLQSEDKGTEKYLSSKKDFDKNMEVLQANFETKKATELKSLVEEKMTTTLKFDQQKNALMLPSEQKKAKCESLYSSNKKIDFNGIKLDAEDYNNIQAITSFLVLKDLKNLTKSEMAELKVFLRNGRITEYTNIKDSLQE